LLLGITKNKIKNHQRQREQSNSRATAEQQQNNSRTTAEQQHIVDKIDFSKLDLLIY
jgi:hypothetical protein